MIIIWLHIRLCWKSQSLSQSKLEVCIIRLWVEVNWKKKSDYYPEQSQSTYNSSRVRPIAFSKFDKIGWPIYCSSLLLCCLTHYQNPYFFVLISFSNLQNYTCNFFNLWHHILPGSKTQITHQNQHRIITVTGEANTSSILGSDWSESFALQTPKIISFSLTTEQNQQKNWWLSEKQWKWGEIEVKDEIFSEF